MPIFGGRWVSLWLRIEYKNGGLSISGVEGPLATGNAIGACGQCGINESARPTEGYDLATLAKLREVWDRWHLNGTRPYSPEMAAAGWPEIAKTPMVGYRFSPTTAAIDARRRAEDAALTALRAGETFVPTPEQTQAASARLYGTIYVREGDPKPEPPAHTELATTAPNRTILGRLRPSEHPEGLLGRKLRPEDEHGYGEKWWREPVPDDVLTWLAALPLPPNGVQTNWWRR